MKAVPEYDLHGRGMLVDDATSELDRLISRARNGGARVFAVVTGYGSTGGTSRSFPDCGLIPNDYKRCPNPGIVFIAV